MPQRFPLRQRTALLELARQTTWRESWPGTSAGTLRALVRRGLAIEKQRLGLAMFRITKLGRERASKL